MKTPVSTSTRIMLIAATLALALAGCGDDRGAGIHQAPATSGPDTIFHNGTIYTMDEAAAEVTALAVTGGRIEAVGSSADISALAGANTEVIDLQGQVVLPGFQDMHVHPLYGGMSDLLCKIPQGSSLAQLQAEVKACAESAEEGAWVTGGQWDASAIGQVPNRQMLDAVSGDVPVMLNDTSGHSLWVNTKVLELAGITADTEAPPGGIIERDADGNPTGVFRETANDLARMHAPPPTDELVKRGLLVAIDKMLAAGITAYSEASLGFVGGLEREAALYATLAAEGAIKHRTRVCMTWSPEVPAIDMLIGQRAEFESERVAFDCVKMFLDGVPTDSHTAAMLEPYAREMEGRDDEASRYGLLLIDQQVLNEAVTRFDAMGLTVKFHAAGDAAVRAGINAIEAAREANGDSGLSHNVGHTTFVASEDIPRVKALNAAFELSPYLWSPSPINDDITLAIGEERIERVWPFREIIDSGSLVVAGSDWAVVPSVNPWIAMESLVTRQEMGGSEREFGGDQAITVDEAIRLFTVNAAKHMRKADDLGRLIPGMLADLIVIDRDPYKIPATELHQVAVQRTVIAGETVFEAN